MSSDRDKRLPGILGDGAKPPRRQMRSKAPQGFHRYSSASDREEEESQTEFEQEKTDTLLGAGYPRDSEITRTLAGGDPGAPPSAPTSTPRARPEKPRDPDTPARRRRRKKKPPRLTSAEVVRQINSAIEQDTISRAEANSVESGLLICHQCALRDADGTEFYIWSSSEDDDLGLDGATHHRFFVATGAAVNGLELTPEVALQLGTLLRTAQTHVPISGEESFRALVAALLHGGFHRR